MAVGHWTVDNYFTFSVTNDSNNDTNGNNVGHWTVDNYFTFSVTNDSNNDTNGCWSLDSRQLFYL